MYFKDKKIYRNSEERPKTCKEDFMSENMF